MATDQHLCPYGLKARNLLERRGFVIDDHKLTSRAETEAFKAEHHVETTPQAFIGGERIGGYSDLRRYFGLASRDPKNRSQRPYEGAQDGSGTPQFASQHARSL